MGTTTSYTFIPFEYPKSQDGNYFCVLDDGQVLRSRREQLGLSVQQVADMAGIQFSQYQRLESGGRFFSGCSMRIGLSICAVLLLDPYDFFTLNVKQADPSILKPQEVFDAKIKNLDDFPKKAGRKPIRRDIMTVYFNHPFYSVIIPKDVLISLGKPEFIQLLHNKNEKRILIRAMDNSNEFRYDIPSLLYTEGAALVFPHWEYIDSVASELGWDTDLYAVECRLVFDKNNNQFVLCDLKTAVPSDRIDGPYIISSCLEDEED